MPILRIKEIRDMSSEQRMDRLDEFRTELVRLKTMIRAGGNVENPARVRELRKAIAKILTIETEQKLEQVKEKEEEEEKEEKQEKQEKKQRKKKKEKEKEE